MRLSRYEDGIPVVASDADRDARFPTPRTNQRVQNLTSGWIERWDGAEWVGEVPTSATAGRTINVLDPRFGATGDGTTDDSSAIQAALDAASFGDTVLVPRTAAGYLIGASSLSVPDGVILLGGGQGQQAGRWVPGTGITSATTPGGTMFKITNTSNRPIKLGSSSVVSGFTFWYPDQTWDIDDLGDSFVEYPATIQLGLTAGQPVYNQQILNCHFLGATVGIEQLDDDGFAVNSLHVENCSGVVFGPVVRVHVASDSIRLRNLTFNPVYAASYVGDATVGGDQDTFRTKVAQVAKLAEFGHVSDLDLVNCYVLGMLYMVHYKDNVYTGDDHEEGSGRFTNCLADTVHAMVRYDRAGSNSSPLAFVNCWANTTFRPNGVAGDTATQAMLLFGAAAQSYRVSLHNVRAMGIATGAFLAGYEGVPDYAFRSTAALGGATQILGNGVFVHNATLGFADTNIAPALLLRGFARDDNRADGAVTFRGDEDATLVVGEDAEIQRYVTELTQNRTVTLSDEGAFHGARFRIVRTGLGAFTLDVGGLKTIPSATAAWVEAVHTGAGWILAGYGTL